MARPPGASEDLSVSLSAQVWGCLGTGAGQEEAARKGSLNLGTTHFSSSLLYSAHSIILWNMYSPRGSLVILGETKRQVQSYPGDR